MNICSEWVQSTPTLIADSSSNVSHFPINNDDTHVIHTDTDDTDDGEEANHQTEWVDLPSIGSIWVVSGLWSVVTPSEDRGDW